MKNQLFTAALILEKQLLRLPWIQSQRHRGELRNQRIRNYICDYYPYNNIILTDVMILTCPVLRSIGTKPKTAFPFRKPKIASIQCFEAPEFCQFLMIVTFQSPLSSGLHFSHLTSAWACLILWEKFSSRKGRKHSPSYWVWISFILFYFPVTQLHMRISGVWNVRINLGENWWAENRSLNNLLHGHQCDVQNLCNLLQTLHLKHVGVQM